MATNLINDQISNIPVEFDNLVGQKLPAPSGDQWSLSLVDGSGSPSSVGTAVVGQDNSSVDITPTPADGTNMGTMLLQASVTLTDGTVVTLSPLDLVFTNDPNVANAHFVTTGITTRPVGP